MSLLPNKVLSGRLPFACGDLLRETVGGVSIDLTYIGLFRRTRIPLANTGGSSCGGSCSSGSCGTH